MAVTLESLLPTQEAMWHRLLDLSLRHTQGWSLVGGQMVYLHCVERGVAPARPTDDLDAILDVRAYPGVHLTLTQALKDLGFSPAATSWNDKQHRWIDANGIQFDVLIPRGLGERAAQRRGAGGSPTIETPGAQQALNRTEHIDLRIGDRTGKVPRPSLVGALVGKAAAHTVSLDTARDRHIQDFALLCRLISYRDDFSRLRKRDIYYLQRMHHVITANRPIWRTADPEGEGLQKLEKRLNFRH